MSTDSNLLIDIFKFIGTAVAGAFAQDVVRNHFHISIITLLKRPFFYVTQTLFLVIGKKIIIYADCNDKSAAIKSIENRLAEKLHGKRLWIKTISDPEEILAEPFAQCLTHAVIVLITNVTSLSLNVKSKEKIQERINSFCQNGGIVVLGHDAIYRRTSHETFEAMAGGRLEGYDNKEKIVKYKRNDSEKRKIKSNLLRENLPESAELTDGEYLRGTWREEVEFLYILSQDSPPPGTEKTFHVPLVTRKLNGKGASFWINSGDSGKKGPPISLSLPENDLIKILSAIIIYGKDRSPD